MQENRELSTQASSVAPPRAGKRSFFSLFWRMIRKTLCQSVIPFNPVNCMRIWGYRLVGFKIGKSVFIGMRCYLDDTYPHRLVIEDNVVISYQVTFATHGPRIVGNTCVLRKGCYIGCRVTIIGGVEIGRYATIGAASLVHRSVPAFAKAVGVPAKVIKENTVPADSQDSELPRLLAEYEELRSQHPQEGQS